ncbi:trehalose-phosphatase [Corynebacterium auris]|uniref:trehalose-phosphatase n=1 Tax=Corynebacterium auris TaxID=44750 RepID=UPI0025B42146|nr:trehalose-phosphatase [Corynebacterium auris]WJY68770.1 Trehalose-phosphate phosphatase [Corynebacterium auris]
MSGIDTALRRLAGAPTLLVCLDFDGTIAEIVPDAAAARAHPEALQAIEALSQLPKTTVAVLSGRHLDGLRSVFPLGDPVVLVGSHGAETTAGGPQLTAADRQYLQRVEERLAALAEPPAFVEVKPYQRVLHVAALAATEPDKAAALLARALEIDAEGRPVTPGKNVVEFSALDITKGTWLGRAKRSFSATLFAGDDTTDEAALAVLDSGDVGIKVGDKPSIAGLRLRTVPELAAFLTCLARARGAR